MKAVSPSRCEKRFSVDWTTDHTGVWRKVLAPWRQRKVRVLEIGTWEGRSALFFLTYLTRSTITCVDHFRGTPNLHDRPEHARWVRQVRFIEARFDRNLASFQRRVEKLKGASVAMLDRLIARRRAYDLIYLDASHKSDDVMADSVRAWTLLKRGGYLIWDDYGWRPKYPVSERPQQAIDAFLDAHRGAYALVLKRYQVIVRRL